MYLYMCAHMLNNSTPHFYRQMPGLLSLRRWGRRRSIWGPPIVITARMPWPQTLVGVADKRRSII